MRANNRIGARGVITTAGAAIAALMVMGAAFSQQPPGRTRETPPEAGGDEQGGGRQGGIPRNLSVDRSRDQKEGLEEGTPDVTLQPKFKEALPRWVPPRGDYKLGVWAYNTDAGVVITRVLPGSPAARQGLERGDTIVTIGGYQVGYVGDLLYPLGHEVQRQVDRRGDVLLLVQNVRNRELQSMTVNLGRNRSDRPGLFPVEPR